MASQRSPRSWPSRIRLARELTSQACLQSGLFLDGGSVRGHNRAIHRIASLDRQVRVGNSVVVDPAVHPLAFDWHSAFPEVFVAGGFDVVIGNPPYVRQEWISPYKPYFQQHYRA